MQRTTMLHLLFSFILVLISIHLSSATDVKCVISTQIRGSANIGSGFTASDWCCPASYPIFGGDEAYWRNNLSYKDANGTVYGSLPTCLGCIDTGFPKTCVYTPSYGGRPVHYCCPSGYTCSTISTYCTLTGPTRRLDGIYVSYTSATPAADYDLCRFTKDSKGMIVKTGSPCDPRFICEPQTQSQYKCNICTDPRVFPAGVCNTFKCATGNYCPRSWTVNATNVTATLMIQSIICPRGFYCPDNSSEPIACLPGQWCDVGVPYPRVCSEGYYCETGASMKKCPVGSYCPFTSSQPIPCEPGSYCDTEGLSSPIPCEIGSFCDTGNTASACPPGYICPSAEMSAPISCQPQQYCPYSSMSDAYTCNAGSWCPDTLTMHVCPSGSSCPIGSTAAIACESGHYSSNPGSAFCQSCSSIWLTSKGGAKSCIVPTPLLIGMICFGIVIVIGLVIGSVFLVRYCTKLQKAQEEQRVKEAQLATRSAEMRQQHDAAMAAKQQMEMQQAASQSQAEIEMQSVTAETIAVDFEANRTRVKMEIIERLMHDLRTDMTQYYPLPIQDNGNPPSSQQQHRQQYEQFLTQTIVPQFDNPACELFPALNMLVANPYTYSTVDFHYSLVGIRSVVIESFPAHQGIVEAIPGGDASELQPIRDDLMRELSRHVQSWLIKMSDLSSPDSGSTVVLAPAISMHHPQVVSNQSDAPLITSPSQMSPPVAVQFHVAAADMPLPGVPIVS